MSVTVIEGARLIDPASGLDAEGRCVLEDGVIAAAGPEAPAPAGAQIIAAHGLILCPGLVDMMAFRYDNKAALAGGITAIALMPDQDPVLENEAMITHAARRSPGLVKVYPMGAATKGLAGTELAEIGLMAQAGAVAFTDGRNAIADAGLMRQVMRYVHHHGRILLHHAEDPSLAAGGVMNEGETATRLGLAGVPVAAEAILVDRDIRLARLTGAALHFQLLSSAEAIAALRAARSEGLPVSAGLSPPYFTLNETTVGTYRTFAKLSPPLRTEDDRRACVDAIADGTIGVICSAHDPKDQESKRLPFSEAAFGAIGFETLLPLTLALHHNDGVPLMTLIRAMTETPARLLGLPGGRMSPGAPANLLLFDPDAPATIAADRLLSEAKNTPFDGLPVQGRVERCFIDGRTVYQRLEAAA